jgi:lipopolysaccharide assembly outer membrane protein LptD (OstA)
LHSKIYHIVLSAIFLTLALSKGSAQETNTNTFTTNPLNVVEIDTSGTISELTLIEKDTTKADSVLPKKAKSMLEGKVNYTAEDYTKMNQKNKTITLYNKAELYYLDIELKAGIIVLDYEKNEVYAGRIKDSTGTYTQYPYFKQGMNVVEPDSIRFNFKTQKALVWNSRTEQGEFKVKGEVTKRVNDSVYFIKNAKFTTSKDIDDPEYYFLASKIKLVPRKKVVTGFTNMYIADVPTPIAVPFAFFPMSDKAVSGILLPSFQDTRQQGYSLQNFGVYLALSDFYDLTVTGDYFTNGSYGARFMSDYGLRYRFRGNVNVRFENLIQSERGFPDYSKTSIYNIQWSHSQDAKSNPSSRFSASVNLGSSRYFQQSLNQINVGSTLNNNLSSSVSYSKTFNSVPQVNLSVTATHNQNTQTQVINMTLPTFQASVDRIFPFAPKDGIKRGVFKNINLQYNIRGENRFQTSDSLFFKPEMFKDAQTGFQHSIPIATNFKVFNHFSVSAGSNFNEVWYFKTIQRDFDENENRVVTSDVNGFESFRTYDFTANIGTTIYGTFDFGEDKKFQSLRHVMRPTVSYSYTPSFEQYYDTYALDASGRMADYTRFEGGIFGAPGKNFANNVGFALSNTFEAKVRDKDSTKVDAKKIMLLNNLNLSTSYNIAADSLNWSPMRVSGGTNLFENKMAINFAATLDPYAVNNSGRRINTYNIDNGGSLFRMTSANMTMNYSLEGGKGDKKGEKPKNTQGQRNGGRDDDLFGVNNELSDLTKSQFGPDDDDDEDKFSDFYRSKVPWNLTLAYALTYGNNAREDKIIGNSLMFSGNMDVTPRWRVGVSSGYDFAQQGFTFTQFRFERDLLSWRMDFSWSPFGINSFWGFFIGIKSSALSDLKFDRRSLPDRTLR